MTAEAAHLEASTDDKFSPWGPLQQGQFDASTTTKVT